VKATVVAACCLALVACASGGETAAPTTSTPTTASPVTTAAPTTTVSTSVAPTTATTVASRFVTNKVVVTDHGDGTGTITPEYLEGSHMQLESATQPGGYRSPDGTLFVASNPGFDQTWLLSMNTLDLKHVVPSQGWTFAPVSSDPQWTPDACGGVYHALVGTRFEVLSDAAPLVPRVPTTTAPTDAPIYNGRITVFDLVKRQFFDILPFPNDHTYFQPVAADDHTLEVLYAPEPASGPVVGAVKWTHLVRRRVDLTTFAYVDQEVVLPHDSFEMANEAQDRSIDLGWTETPTDYRTVRGHVVDAPIGRLKFVVDSTAPTYDWVVDGVKVTNDASGTSTSFTKLDGSPIATLPAQPQLSAYRSGLLYLLMNIPATADPNPPFGPAVYDPTSGVVAPLFDYSSPANVGVFVVGILPR
jgi:hypothetical protein